MARYFGNIVEVPFGFILELRYIECNPESDFGPVNSSKENICGRSKMIFFFTVQMVLWMGVVQFFPIEICEITSKKIHNLNRRTHYGL